MTRVDYVIEPVELGSGVLVLRCTGGCGEVARHGTREHLEREWADHEWAVHDQNNGAGGGP